MTDEQRQRIVDAAVAYVVWENKVPTPPNNYEESEKRKDELHSAVMAIFTNEGWWAETYAPGGWPE